MSRYNSVQLDIRDQLSEPAIRGVKIQEDLSVRMRRDCVRRDFLFACLLGFAGISLSAGAHTAAPNEWTWMGRSSTLLPVNGAPSSVGRPGVYGTLGVPAAGNVPGGRYSAVTWTDQNGNLWLFGGMGYDSGNGVGDLNDLWEFNLSTQEWTWMGGGNLLPDGGYDGGLPGVYGTLGVAAPGNIPGGREGAATWTDKNGNLWLFGGEA